MVNLTKFFKKKEKDIIEQWFDSAANTYPSETYAFLKREKDGFANPVGNTMKYGLGVVFSEIIGDMDKKIIKEKIDSIMRIRAVQFFSPSEALSFIFSLKNIIRKEVLKKFPIKEISKELFQLEAKIDEVLFISFDSYSECREKLNDIKANELKDRTYKAFKRAGLLTEIEPEPMVIS